MGRITIKDLAENQKISNEEMRKVMGGVLPLPLPYPTYQQQYSLGTIGTLPLPIPYPIGFRGVLPTPLP